MSTLDLTGSPVEPLVGEFFQVWTEPAWLPYGKVGFDSVDGMGLGKISFSEYAAGNDRFFKTLLGRTSHDPITLSGSATKTRYCADWFLAATEYTEGLPPANSGGPRLAASPFATIYIGVTDRTQAGIVQVLFAGLVAVPVEHKWGSLKSKASAEPWSETLVIKYQRPKLKQPTSPGPVGVPPGGGL